MTDLQVQELLPPQTHDLGLQSRVLIPGYAQLHFGHLHLVLELVQLLAVASVVLLQHTAILRLVLDSPQSP